MSLVQVRGEGVTRGLVVDLFAGVPLQAAERAIRRYQAAASGMPDERGCIDWRGELRSDGYGILTVEVAGKRHRFRPYRLAYEAANGLIPAGLTIDHLCRNPRCINPDHLEPVSRAVNTVRQMAAIHGSDPGRVCKNGHAGEYKRDPRSGKLWCGGCHRDRARRLYVPHPAKEQACPA